MPSPIGHVLAGATVCLITTRKENRSRLILGVTLLGSILPDFDFLPGILIGDPAAFHHGISHSLAFAIAYGAFLFLLLRHFKLETSATRPALLGGLAYVSHLILDLVSVNEGARAMPILWPLLDDRFGLNLHLFGHFHHGGFNRGIWSVVRWDNLPAIGRELAVLGPPVLLLSFWRERRVRATLPQRP